MVQGSLRGIVKNDFQRACQFLVLSFDYRDCCKFVLILHASSFRGGGELSLRIFPRHDNISIPEKPSTVRPALFNKCLTLSAGLVEHASNARGDAF